MQKTDLIIIGAGPGGISAAVYAARQKIDFIVISKDLGGQTILTWDIENYLGYQFITGQDLSDKFKEHLKQYNINFKEGEAISELKKQDNKFLIKTDKEEYECTTVVIASGKKPRYLNIPGEKDFKNKGLTYCATCDGPLFSKKDIAIIGGGNAALEASLQMSKIANKVYLVNINNDIAGEETLKETVKSLKNIEILNNTQTKEIKGDKFVKSIIIETDKETKELNVEGVFVEIGSIPSVDFVDNLKDLKKNKYNEIIVNNKNETSIPGLFAAGDVTDVPEKQIIVAAGEGAKAALSSFKYLSTLKE